MMEFLLIIFEYNEMVTNKSFIKLLEGAQDPDIKTSAMFKSCAEEHIANHKLSLI